MSEDFAPTAVGTEAGRHRNQDAATSHPKRNRVVPGLWPSNKLTISLVAMLADAEHRADVLVL